tara:strand:- start:1160 stop:1663 length:504 start_codon:yes stop_codon:yes gene_type:complete
MSNIEDKIKKVVEKNINLNMKSVKDRNKLVSQLSELVSSKSNEVAPQQTRTTTRSENFDMFEAIKNGVEQKKQNKKRIDKNSISNNPDLNPMTGFIPGQSAKMVNDNDIDDYYKSIGDKKKPKKSKSKNVKPKKPTIEEIASKKMNIPSRNVKRNLNSLNKDLKPKK